MSSSCDIVICEISSVDFTELTSLGRQVIYWWVYRFIFIYGSVWQILITSLVCVISDVGESERKMSSAVSFTPYLIYLLNADWPTIMVRLDQCWYTWLATLSFHPSDITINWQEQFFETTETFHKVSNQLLCNILLFYNRKQETAADLQ